MDLCVMVCVCNKCVCVWFMWLLTMWKAIRQVRAIIIRCFGNLPGSTSRAVKDVTRICARESRSDLITVQTRKLLEINAFDWQLIARIDWLILGVIDSPWGERDIWQNLDSDNRTWRRNYDDLRFFLSMLQKTGFWRTVSWTLGEIGLEVVSGRCHWLKELSSCWCIQSDNFICWTSIGSCIGNFSRNLNIWAIAHTFTTTKKNIKSATFLRLWLQLWFLEIC